MINLNRNKSQLYIPPHPYPARMAPEIALSEIPHNRSCKVFLDPMVGSGTSAAVARSQGFFTIGFDTDPLAVLISDVWLNPPDVMKWESAKSRIERVLKNGWRDVPGSEAYPIGSSDEEKSFVRYWFDLQNRKQMKLLTELITNLSDIALRKAMSCLLSRTIISKNASTSLARDVSHSRPHKIHNQSQYDVISRFNHSAFKMEKSWSLWKITKHSQGDNIFCRADARFLPLPDQSVDLIVTSPPYFNAIDYIRAHKFSLIWLGYLLNDLRLIRGSNIGTERMPSKPNIPLEILRAAKCECMHKSLSPRFQNIFIRYASDINNFLGEISRVLIPGGKVTIVVADSFLQGSKLRTSRLLTKLAIRNNLVIISKRTREIAPGLRYLPPPVQGVKKGISLRMRQESVLTFSHSN